MAKRSVPLPHIKWLLACNIFNGTSYQCHFAANLHDIMGIRLEPCFKERAESLV